MNQVFFNLEKSKCFDNINQTDFKLYTKKNLVSTPITCPIL